MRRCKLLDANIRAAIVDVMQRKGYVEAPAGTTPDLRIAYETAKTEKLENNPVRVGIGVGSWGGNMGGSVSMGSPSVRNFSEGTLVVHAIDTARNVEVTAWGGLRQDDERQRRTSSHQPGRRAGDGGLPGALARGISTQGRLVRAFDALCGRAGRTAVQTVHRTQW